MKICIAGKNKIAVKALKHLLNKISRDNLLVCPNQSDNGISGWQPSLRRYAAEFGVNSVSLQDCYAQQNLIFLSLEFDKIVNPRLFNSHNLYNIHFSSLPAYKGMYTSAWPIINGVASSGVTLHEIDHGIDTGDIIDQINFPLSEDETARTLYFKYLDYGYSIFEKNVEIILSGKYPKKHQSADNSSYYSKSSINYANLRIDTRKTALDVARQIRAFTFREYQMPSIDGISIGRFSIVDERSINQPGTFKNAGGDRYCLSTIDYDILIEKSYDMEFLRAINELDIENCLRILEKGVDVELTGSNGWTPLMIAAYHGCIDLCKVLLARNADPNARNQNGTTVLMYAKEAAERTGSFEICNLLIKHGADPNREDEFGMTVLMHSMKRNQRSSIDYFSDF